MNETLVKDLEEISVEYNLLPEEENVSDFEENSMITEESTTTSEDIKEESTTTFEDIEEESTTTSEIIIDNSDVIVQLQSINDTLGIILVVLLFIFFRNWINDIFSKIISCGK